MSDNAGAIVYTLGWICGVEEVLKALRPDAQIEPFPKGAKEELYIAMTRLRAIPDADNGAK